MIFTNNILTSPCNIWTQLKGLFDIRFDIYQDHSHYNSDQLKIGDHQGGDLTTKVPGKIYKCKLRCKW